MEGRAPQLFSALALEVGTWHRREIDLSGLAETERANQLQALDNGALWSTVPKYLFDDETFVITVAARYPASIMLHAASHFKRHRTLAFVVLARHGLALEFFSEDLRGDKEVVLTAVANNGRAVRYASDALKEDVEVGLAAVLTTPGCKRYLAFALQWNEEICAADEYWS